MTDVRTGANEDSPMYYVGDSPTLRRSALLPIALHVDRHAEFTAGTTNRNSVTSIYSWLWARAKT
jgi:hypothetical protein